VYCTLSLAGTCTLAKVWCPTEFATRITNVVGRLDSRRVNRLLIRDNIIGHGCDSLPRIVQSRCGRSFANKISRLISSHTRRRAVKVAEGFDHCDAREVDFLVHGSCEEGCYLTLIVFFGVAVLCGSIVRYHSPRDPHSTPRFYQLRSHASTPAQRRCHSEIEKAYLWLRSSCISGVMSAKSLQLLSKAATLLGRRSA
jgi:hypothetical protein